MPWIRTRVSLMLLAFTFDAHCPSEKSCGCLRGPVQVNTSPPSPAITPTQNRQLGKQAARGFPTGQGTQGDVRRRLMRLRSNPTIMHRTRARRPPSRVRSADKQVQQTTCQRAARSAVRARYGDPRENVFACPSRTESEGLASPRLSQPQRAITRGCRQVDARNLVLVFDRRSQLRPKPRALPAACSLCSCCTSSSSERSSPSI